MENSASERNIRKMILDFIFRETFPENNFKILKNQKK